MNISAKSRELIAEMRNTARRGSWRAYDRSRRVVERSRSTPGWSSIRKLMERCSPRSAPFPLQPPPKVALLCSAGSLVVRRSPTAPERSRPPFGLWPSRTGLALEAKTSRSSLGSRACCFSACAGSNDYAGPTWPLAYNVAVVLPSSSRNGVGVLYQRLFEAQ